jgi:hypothetical protein
VSAKDRRSWTLGLERTFSRDVWHQEWAIVVRRRRALMFLLSGLICVGAFAAGNNLYVSLCFVALAIFSAVNGLRLGVLVCLVGALRWGLRSRSIISHDGSTDQALMICFLACLGFLLVAKADHMERDPEDYG